MAIYPADADLQSQTSMWLHIQAQKNTANRDIGNDQQDEIVWDCWLPAPQNLVEGNAHNWETVALGSLKTLTDTGSVATGEDSASWNEMWNDAKGGFQNLYRGLGLPWPKAFGATELFRHVANPRNELQYQSPALRTWSFSWQFASHTEGDAATLDDIVSEMKRLSYPIWFSGVRMTMPHEFWIDVVSMGYGGGANKMNKIARIGKCVIQNMQINQSGAGMLTQFQGQNDTGSPFVNLDITFSEVQARRANSKALGGDI
jgi:hypothetical protein